LRKFPGEKSIVVGKEADQSDNEDDEAETEIQKGEFVGNGVTGFLDDIPVDLSLGSHASIGIFRIL